MSSPKTTHTPLAVIMSYLLVLAAFVSSAVIPKHPSQAINPIQSLSERTSLAHDYAIVCAYEKKATNFCQKYYGYGCDASGRVRKTVFDHDCDVLCSCVNLYPKPRCLIGITGAAYCMRSLDGDENDMVEHVEGQGISLASSLLRESEDSVGSEASQAAGVPPFALSMLPRDLSTAANVPRIATVYNPQNPEHAGCADGDCCQGISGVVARDGQHDRSCVTLPGSLDSVSDIQYVADDDGIMTCDETDDVPVALNSAVLNVNRPDYEFLPRNRPSHDYAMVCADDRQETGYCQNDGYYCDSAGHVALRAPNVSNKFCNDKCKCVSVGLRAYDVID